MGHSRRFNRLTEFAVVIGVILVLAGVLKVYQTASNVHAAVCELRAERIRGIQDAKMFLKQHPNGIAGISKADIERSIDQQQETVRAFSFADC